MIKREKSIELLNKAVAEEMTALNQYMYFHFRLEDMGYDFLAKQFRRVAITEMIHLEKFAERILYLKGDVELKFARGIEKIHDVKEMLKKSERLETDTIEKYNTWAKECGDMLDSASKTLFEEIIIEEESHQDNFDTEIDNMQTFGDKYLVLHSIEGSKNVAEGKNIE